MHAPVCHESNGSVEVVGLGKFQVIFSSAGGGLTATISRAAAAAASASANRITTLYNFWTSPVPARPLSNPAMNEWALAMSPNAFPTRWV